MRLVDTVLKVMGPEVWLHHTVSSYRVRMDAAALAALESVLTKTGVGALTESEAMIHERLSRRGLLVDDGTSHRAPVLRKSRLKTLDLELSSRCNLECGHCFASLDRKTDMGRDTLMRVFDAVAALEPVSLVLNGGEPLLNSEWRFAVSEARCRGLRVVVFTNGTLVTDEVASFIAAARVAKVSISLDGFRARHDALRGPRAFDRAVAGIRRLVERGVQVFVTTMMSDDMLSRRDEFLEYCLGELGVLSVQFTAVVPVGKGASAPAAFQMDDAALQAMYRPTGIQDDDDPVADAGRAWPCEAGVEQIFVASDGGVYACHYFHNLREPMGYLEQDSLESIYLAGLAGPVAARPTWTELPGCRDCPALAACRTGCRARAKLLSGSFDAPDPHSCRIYR